MNFKIDTVEEGISEMENYFEEFIYNVEYRDKIFKII